MNDNKPNIKVRVENETFKVLEIRGEPGDQLSSHKVDNDAILQVISGFVIYKEGSTSINLCDEVTHSIPRQQIHMLEFIENSKLLLFLFKNTKMQFSS